MLTQPAQPQLGSQQASAHPQLGSQQLLQQLRAALRAARRARILANRPHRGGLQQESQQSSAHPQEGSQELSAQPQLGSQQLSAHPQLGSQPQPPSIPKNAFAFEALLSAMATLKPSVDSRR